MSFIKYCLLWNRVLEPFVLENRNST